MKRQKKRKAMKISLCKVLSDWVLLSLCSFVQIVTIYVL